MKRVWFSVVYIPTGTKQVLVEQHARLQHGDKETSIELPLAQSNAAWVLPTAEILTFAATEHTPRPVPVSAQVVEWVQAHMGLTVSVEDNESTDIKQTTSTQSTRHRGEEKLILSLASVFQCDEETADPTQAHFLFKVTGPLIKATAELKTLWKTHHNLTLVSEKDFARACVNLATYYDEDTASDSTLRQHAVTKQVAGVFQPLHMNLQIRNNTASYLDADIAQGRTWKISDFLCLDPVHYLQAAQAGKKIRSKTVHKLAALFHIHDQDLDALVTSIEQYHALSLLLDDIEDDSIMRRKQKCAHLVFGTPWTLNAAYMSSFKILNNVPQLFRKHHSKTQALIIEALVAIHRGQGLDILWRQQKYCPSEKEYLGMIRGKTGVPFNLAAKLFFLHSDDWRLTMDRVVTKSAVFAPVRNLMAYTLPYVCPSFVTNFVLPSENNIEETVLEVFDKLGLFFQIRDDYVNLTDAKYWKIKGYCDDLHEKQFSFPVIHLVQTRGSRYKDLLALYAKDSEPTKEELDEMLDIVTQAGSLAYTKRVCQEMKTDILKTLKQLSLTGFTAIVESLKIS